MATFLYSICLQLSRRASSVAFSDDQNQKVTEILSFVYSQSLGMLRSEDFRVKELACLVLHYKFAEMDAFEADLIDLILNQLLLPSTIALDRLNTRRETEHEEAVRDFRHECDMLLICMKRKSELEVRTRFALQLQ